MTPYHEAGWILRVQISKLCYQKIVSITIRSRVSDDDDDFIRKSIRVNQMSLIWFDSKPIVKYKGNY